MKYTRFIAPLARKKSPYQAFAVLFIFILFSSCNFQFEDQLAQLELRVHINGNSLTYDKVYNINGKAVAFSLAQFYLSGVSLSDDKGQTDVFLRYEVVAPGTNIIILGNLSIKNIKNMYFIVGLDSITNHANPLLYSSDDPLAIQTPSMYWNQERGYIFLNLQGTVDNDGDGTPETPFEYRIGSDVNAKYTTLPLTIDVKNQIKNDLVRICAEADVAAFLANIDFSQQLTTQTTDNPALAAQIAGNIPVAFTATTCP